MLGFITQASGEGVIKYIKNYWKNDEKHLQSFRAEIPLKEYNLIKSIFYSNVNYMLVYEQIKKKEYKLLY